MASCLKFALYMITVWSLPNVGTLTVNGNGINNSHKTWWLKKISSDVYTAGRLSHRQIKYLSEAGVKSVISLFRFHNRSMLGDEVLPNSEESLRLAIRLCHVKFVELIQFEELAPHQWANNQTVERLGRAMNAVPKPLVVFCKDGFASTFLTILHLAVENSTNHDGLPKPTVRDIQLSGAMHGYDFTSALYSEAIANITGDHSKVVATPPDVNLKNWNDFWLIKPVIGKWYLAGQIRHNHVSALKELGFMSIVNTRKRVLSMLSGDPSQEIVTLLNVRDDLKTYTGEGRQTEKNLLANRINPAQLNEYISKQSKVNYESRNFAEYGDAVGYNETLEGIHVRSNSLDYLSVPLDVDGPFPYTVEQFNKFKERILAESQKGAVLVHCASGHRAGIVVLALAGLQNGLNSSWAIRRAEEMGYTYTIDAVNVLRTILDAQPEETAAGPGKEVTSPHTHAHTTVSVIMYAAVGIILAVISIIVVYLLRRRKTPQVVSISYSKLW